MWPWLLAAAWAAQVEVVPVEGALRAGHPSQVLVAVSDAEGRPPQRPPEVAVSGGEMRLDAALAPGVWAYRLLPAPGVEEVRFDVTALGRITTRLVRLDPAPAPTLEVPGRLDGLAGGGEVRFRVTGPDLPPPEALQVVVAGGEVRAVEAKGEALEVVLLPEESPFPRYLPIGVLDLRAGGSPSWAGLRLRTHPRVALQTDPGTEVTLTVSGRRYGPFEADAEGLVTGHVAQYPGEMVAQAVLVDGHGNETTASLPLSSHTQPALIALASGPVLPGGAPPVIHLRGVHGDGHPWQGAAPVCRTALIGALEVRATGPGSWMLPLREVRLDQAIDLRVHCSLGGAAETSVRIAPVEGLASRLRLRVWPEELSADFPVAEVQVLLEDARGDRLPVVGVEVEAERGEIRLEPEGGFMLRGEYRGHDAAAAGEDIIRARYRPPVGDDLVGRVRVGHGPIGEGGEVAVHGRALDLQGRPVPGVDLALSAGAGPAYATTGPDGWAQAVVSLPEERGPVVLEVRHRDRVARTVVLRGGSATAGPGIPDLATSRIVPITAGRVAGMFLTVDPPLLHTGAGAAAQLRIGVVDRGGYPVSDALIEVTASEGAVGPVVPSSEGGYRAEYHPPPGDRPQEVTLVARYEGASATARLLLEPRPVARVAGIAAGVTSNLGRITSPFLSVDLDWRTGWFGGTAMIRLGAGVYGDVSAVETGLGDPARLRLDVYPITVGLLTRQDAGGRALWLGIAGVIAPYRLEARFGDELASQGVGVLPPGLGLLGGAAQRVGQGEVMLELRATALSSPGGPLAYQGPIGGLAAVVGYRVEY